MKMPLKTLTKWRETNALSDDDDDDDDDKYVISQKLHRSVRFLSLAVLALSLWLQNSQRSMHREKIAVRILSHDFSCSNNNSATVLTALNVTHTVNAKLSVRSSNSMSNFLHSVSADISGLP